MSKDKKQPSLHDAFFKEFFSRPEFAFELFKLVFSQEEMKIFDWPKLKPEKDSLKGKRADLVFSVPLKRNSKTHIKIFILLEHKSSYQKALFIQLLHYQTILYQRSIEETGHPSPILPVVFYHGKTPWKWPLSYQETFFDKFLTETAGLFRENMLSYTLKLMDVNDPKIKKVFKDPEFKSRGALYLLKEIWGLKADVESIGKVLEINKDFFGKGDDLALSIVQYLLKGVSGMSEGLWGEVYKMGVAKGYFPEGGNYMGIREYIKEEGLQEGLQKGLQKGLQEGLQKGLQKGLQQGLQKGLQQGLQKVALKMRKEGAEIAFVAKVTGLSKEEIEELTNGKNNE